MKGVSVVIFEGGAPASEVEKMLVRIRQAVLLDNIGKIKKVKSIGAVYLLTNYPALAEKVASYGGVIIKESGFAKGEFHFGRALRDLVNREKLERVVYMSGAGVPLITEEELEETCRLLLGSRPIIYSNNTMSSDIVAFTPGSLLNRILPPEQDNNLAVALSSGTGVEHNLFPPSTGFLFDLDTPADLLILAGSPLAGSRTRAALQELNLDFTRLERIKEVLKKGNYQDVVLLGRVGAPVIAKINRSLKVRLRIFSEERGMKALGREKRGEVVSLLGFFLQEVGPQRFIRYIEKVCSAALLDTRVLMAHLKPDLLTEDRYLSDLGRWREMKDSFFREFTRCAVESAVPILLGGHSLVLGGLWALAEEIGQNI
ncbi:MAG: hypothetical protein GXZ07_03275 [Firmicutes bacterium]|nr:hypothetical protein [Bacillota bacterium]